MSIFEYIIMIMITISILSSSLIVGYGSGYALAYMVDKLSGLIKR